MSTTNDQQTSQNEQTTPSSETPQENQQSSSSSSETQTQETSVSTDLADDSTSSDSGTDLGAEDNSSAELNADGTPKVKAEAPAYFGVPETGTYADFTLPDGAVADPELNESFQGLAKELGLNQEGAQKLVDYKSQLDQHQIKAWGNHLKDLQTQAKADPVIGGAKYAPAVTAGKAAISKFMSAPASADGQPSEAQAFRKMLNDYGVGAHPLMIRFMSRVGAAMGETPALGNGGSAVVSEKPLHELMYGQKETK